jgi:hypothetical protein
MGAGTFIAREKKPGQKHAPGGFTRALVGRRSMKSLFVSPPGEGVEARAPSAVENFAQGQDQRRDSRRDSERGPSPTDLWNERSEIDHEASVRRHLPVGRAGTPIGGLKSVRKAPLGIVGQAEKRQMDRRASGKEMGAKVSWVKQVMAATDHSRAAHATTDPPPTASPSTPYASCAIAALHRRSCLPPAHPRFLRRRPT